MLVNAAFTYNLKIKRAQETNKGGNLGDANDYNTHFPPGNYEDVPHGAPDSAGPEHAMAFHQDEGLTRFHPELFEEDVQMSIQGKIRLRKHI